MKDTLFYRGYSGVVEFEPEDDCYYTEIDGIRDLVMADGRTREELELHFHEVVDSYLDHCQNIGKQPDTPRNPESDPSITMA